MLWDSLTYKVKEAFSSFIVNQVAEHESSNILLFKLLLFFHSEDRTEDYESGEFVLTKWSLCWKAQKDYIIFTAGGVKHILGFMTVSWELSQKGGFEAPLKDHIFLVRYMEYALSTETEIIELKYQIHKA